MRSNEKNSWLGYLKKMRGEGGDLANQNLTCLIGFFNAGTDHPPDLKNQMSYSYILSYRESRYIKMTDSFAGYKAECFTKRGVDHACEIIHPCHLDLFNCEIFPDRLKILKGIAPDEHNEYIFSSTILIKDRRGNHRKFLQKNCFMSDEMANPLFSMGILIDITDFHTDNRVVQTVHKMNTEGQQVHLEQYRKVYFLSDEEKLLSKRELQVLALMSEGFSTKMISDKLYIAEGTVKRHKQNMQDKTGTSNGMALISYGFGNGLI